MVGLRAAMNCSCVAEVLVTTNIFTTVIGEVPQAEFVRHTKVRALKSLDRPTYKASIHFISMSTETSTNHCYYMKKKQLCLRLYS